MTQSTASVLVSVLLAPPAGEPQSLHCFHDVTMLIKQDVIMTDIISRRQDQNNSSVYKSNLTVTYLQAYSMLDMNVTGLTLRDVSIT